MSDLIRQPTWLNLVDMIAVMSRDMNDNTRMNGILAPLMSRGRYTHSYQFKNNIQGVSFRVIDRVSREDLA